MYNATGILQDHRVRDSKIARFQFGVKLGFVAPLNLPYSLSNVAGSCLADSLALMLHSQIKNLKISLILYVKG